MIFSIFLAALALCSCQAVDLGIDIPDIRGNYWALSNIKLIDVDDKGYTITPDEQDKYFRMKISGITMKAQADVSCKATFLFDSAKMSISASASSFTVDFDFGIKQGKPYYKVIKCDLKLNQINVSFSKTNWLYKSLVSVVTPYIKAPLEKAICAYATTL